MTAKIVGHGIMVDDFVESKKVGINPKDLIGSTKPPLHLFPASAHIVASMAMKNGADKYGPYNWREKGKPVGVLTYLGAAQRHIAAFIDREECASDSGVDHLGHAIASLAILIDAMAVGNFVDDRPLPGPAGTLIEVLTQGTKPE